MPDYNAVKSIRDFRSLVRYLRGQLDWPIEENTGENDSFDYNPAELGIQDSVAVKIREIKQIRPLVHGQQWGVFWIGFESKRLPVVVMRRILAALVYKKRANGRMAKQATWGLQDLMFISATGESDARGVSFAHFRELSDGTHQLRTFSWDANERHFYYLEKLNLEALRWPDNTKNIDGWRKRWSEAFTTAHREVITTAQELASRLANLASTTRDLVNEAYFCEKPDGPIHDLYDSLKRVLIHDLTVDDFADMYAQTLAYGLFLAATSPRNCAFKLENAVNLIPNTHPFLRKFFNKCLKVGASGNHKIDPDEIGVGTLIELLNRVDMAAILRDINRGTRGADPVIHFYESFLQQYDAQKKNQRGVFFTPSPIVAFIVHSVDYLLRTKFGCSDGLADNRAIEWRGKSFPYVQILDPATGTGTFLKNVIEKIYATFEMKHRQFNQSELKKKWNEYVSHHLLPRLYGFELMMAPYTVAHLKLGLILKELGYNFSSKERLRVYLTNALEEGIGMTEKLRFGEWHGGDVHWLEEEVDEAAQVKKTAPIMVVLGNPPYSNFGMLNKNDWIRGLLEDYKSGLNEKKINLDDDYIKFIRFGQWRIQQTGQGILAFITNNSYIDGITHRRMRQSLMETFTDIYILDLHGNSKKKEKASDGSKDENVFDIQQGVAISIFVKEPGKHGPARVHHAELCDAKENKFNFLKQNNVSTTRWAQLTEIERSSCLGTFRFFTPKAFDNISEYCEGWPINKLFIVNQNGIKTDRDELFFDFDRQALETRIKAFYSPAGLDSNFRKVYGVVNSSSYNLLSKRHKTVFSPRNIYSCLYRPFDTRWVYYAPGLTSRPAFEVMRHMITGKNLAFVGMRQYDYDIPEYCYTFVSNNLIECRAYISVRGIANIFPLYTYTLPEDISEIFSADTEITRTSNLAPKFAQEFSKNLNLNFISEGAGDLRKTFGPEDSFNYMYSVFHSPTYRKRYAEFLKIDFPRLPLTNNLSLFRKLVAKGKEMVALHLLESPARNKPFTKFVGNGNNEVASGYPKYNDETVLINATQGFEGVPENVWEFHIGGYQVCQKWLKDRRGRTLSAEDKAHYAKIVVALHETIRLMGEIDSVIEKHGGWPGAFSLSGKERSAAES